jgi:hypothetical protein
MNFYNKNVVNPNAPVNKLTSEEFKQQSRNRDKKYNKKIRNVFSIPNVLPAITLGVMKYGGKGIDNVKRVFAPSDSEILQTRLERAYKKRFDKKR